jgi:hypothetical protein
MTTPSHWLQTVKCQIWPSKGPAPLFPSKVCQTKSCMHTHPPLLSLSHSTHFNPEVKAASITKISTLPTSTWCNAPRKNHYNNEPLWKPKIHKFNHLAIIFDLETEVHPIFQVCNWTFMASCDIAPFSQCELLRTGMFNTIIFVIFMLILK